MNESAASRFQNGLATYYEARKYVDSMFEQTRQNAIAELSRQRGEIQGRFTITERNAGAADEVEMDFELYRRRMLEAINEGWKLAIDEIVKACLPKRARSRSRVTTRTVNWKRKALPSMSQSARRLRGEVRRSSARSHVKGRYVPKNPPGKRGRPSIPEREKKRRREIREAKRRSERRAATNSARVAKGWKPYRRARRSEFRKDLWQSEKRKQTARGRARMQARDEMREEKRSKPEKKDRRKNHHPELGYGAPNPRKRRTSAQVKRWGYSKRGIRSRAKRASGLTVAIASGVRATLAMRKRNAGAREYWRKVARRAAEIASGAREVGRPLGSGDKTKRSRKKGGNSGSFGRRENPRNEALAAWKEQKGKILAELRREIGLATWSSKRVAVYRGDPIGKAQARESMEYRNQRVERVRARLAAHWRAKPA